MLLTLNSFLILGALLFCIGLFGALSKRNAVSVLMGIEIMLNAVNITLVAFGSSVLNPVRLRAPDRANLRRLHRDGRGGGSGGGAGDDHRDLSVTHHGGHDRHQPDEMVGVGKG